MHYQYQGGKKGFFNRVGSWVRNLFTRKKGSKPKHKQPYVQAHAKVAREAYVEPNSRARDIDGYLYQPNKSHDKRAVYHHPSKKHTIIGQRGTVVTDAEDLADDVALATGQDWTKKNLRYNTEKRFIKKEVEGPHKVTLTGHSLGSSYASRLGHETGTESHGFNEGSSPHPKVLVEHAAHAFDPNIHKYHVASDVISTTNPFPTERISRKKGQTPHSMNNFIEGGKAALFKHLMKVLA